MRWSLLFLAACGSSTPEAIDAQAELPIDGAIAIDAPVCTMTCGGTCVDTMTDPMHCGSCTHACPTDMPSCAGGTCFAAQETIWEHHFGGSDFGYTVASVTTDADGNVYVTGGMIGTIDLGGGPLTTAGSEDILIASFSPTGAHRWSKTFGSTMIDQGAGIAVAGGKAYVLVDFIGTVDFGGGGLASAGRTDMAIVELDATTGAYVAARRYGSVNDDTGIGIAVDATGAVAISGFFGQGTIDFGGGPMTGPGQDNGFVAAFTATGTYRWAKLLASTTAGSISSGQSVAVDASGNVVVAGVFENGVDFGLGTVTAVDSDAFVASYSPTGTARWVRTFGGPQYDSADTVAIDAAGDVYAAGVFHGPADFGTGPLTSADPVDGYVVGLHAATGATKFARQLNATSGGGIRGVSAGAGAVAITGDFDGAMDLGTGALAPLGMYDIFVASLDPATGAARFAKRYGGADYDEGNSVSIAPGGAVVVGGQFRSTADLGLGAIAGGPDDNGFIMVIAP